jgi:hypothetical protein
LSIFDPNVKYNFIQHCFCDLGSHFEALKSVLLKTILALPRKNMIKRSPAQYVPWVTRYGYFKMAKIRKNAKMQFQKQIWVCSSRTQYSTGNCSFYYTKLHSPISTMEKLGKYQSFSDVRVRVRGLLWSPSPKISDFENPSDSDSACLYVCLSFATKCWNACACISVSNTVKNIFYCGR